MLDSGRMLQQEGFDVTYLPVQRSTGLVDLEEFVAPLAKLDILRYCDPTSVVSGKTGREPTYLHLPSHPFPPWGSPRLEAAITPNTSLVSVMAVNNEIGCFQVRSCFDSGFRGHFPPFRHSAPIIRFCLLPFT